MALRPEQILPLEIFDLTAFHADNKSLVSLSSTCHQLHKRNRKALIARKWTVGITELQKIATTAPLFYTHLQRLAVALKKTNGKYFDDHNIRVIDDDLPDDYEKVPEWLKYNIRQVNHVIICQEYYSNMLSVSDDGQDYTRERHPYAWICPAYFMQGYTSVMCKNNLYLDSKNHLRLTTCSSGIHLEKTQMDTLKQRQCAIQPGWPRDMGNYDHSFMLPLDLFIEVMLQ